MTAAAGFKRLGIAIVGLVLAAVVIAALTGLGAWLAQRSKRVATP